MTWNPSGSIDPHDTPFTKGGGLGSMATGPTPPNITGGPLSGGRCARSEEPDWSEPVDRDNEEE